jgi:uncharacterized protein (DUF1800 family)
VTAAAKARGGDVAVLIAAVLAMPTAWASGYHKGRAAGFRAGVYVSAQIFREAMDGTLAFAREQRHPPQRPVQIATVPASDHSKEQRP